MIHEEMMGILASKNPCDSPPGMVFDPENPTDISPGSSETLYIIGGIPPYTFEILQSSLFYIDDSYIAWPTEYSDATVKATSTLNPNQVPHVSADPTLLRDGTHGYVTWLAGNSQVADQRWNIDLGSAKTIKQIMLENSHNSATDLDYGIKDFDLQGSNDSNSLAQTDYSSDQYWTDIETGLQAAQHSAKDHDDPQIFNFTNDTAYRYYSLKIANNWGNVTYLGFRHVQFHASQHKVFSLITTDPQITIKAPSYALWTARVKCTDLCGTTDEAFLYCTEGKWVYIGGWITGNGPSLCGCEDFLIIRDGCKFVGVSCNDNELGVPGSHECDCSGYGGGIETISILEECGGGPECTHLRNLSMYCWPYD